MTTWPGPPALQLPAEYRTVRDDGVECVAFLNTAYRYSLTRAWHNPDVNNDAAVTWVMLNPSTADHVKDDPTIGRCMGFTRAWGYNGLIVVNLYAWRATDPRELARRRNAGSDVTGIGNNDTLAGVARLAAQMNGPLVAAWGAHAPDARVREVMALPYMDRAQCLGVTKHGQPRHPLYVRGDAKLEPYTYREPTR